MNHNNFSKQSKPLMKSTSETSSHSLSLSQSSSPSQKKLTNKNRRKEHTLMALTRSFIKHVIDLGQDRIDLTKLAKELHVSKRRIYDVTNVLEGIGYIKKHAKNEITWLKSDFFPSLDDDSNNTNRCNENLIKELLELKQENEQIDTFLTELHTDINTLTEKKEWKEYGYITYDDLNTITKEEDCKFIAIQAPDKATVEVVASEENKKQFVQENSDLTNEELDLLGKKHQIFIEAPTGEINVFVIMNNEEIMNDAFNYGGLGSFDSFSGNINESILENNQNDMNM